MCLYCFVFVQAQICVCVCKFLYSCKLRKCVVNRFIAAGKAVHLHQCQTSTMKVQFTSSFIFSSYNSFLSPPLQLLLSAVDLVLFSVFSREGTEGDGDEGRKQLTARRDKVDIGQTVCVMNVRYKTCRCGIGGKEAVHTRC